MNLYLGSCANKCSTSVGPHHAVPKPNFHSKTHATDLTLTTSHQHQQHHVNKNQSNLNDLLNQMLTATKSSQIFEKPAENQLNLVLQRQSTDQQWGFRVQGGCDYHLRLTVCKVSFSAFFYFNIIDNNI